MTNLEKLEYYASKGIGIAVFEDKDSNYKWYNQVTLFREDDSQVNYGYDSFSEALEEGFEIAEWYLRN